MELDRGVRNRAVAGTADADRDIFASVVVAVVARRRRLCGGAGGGRSEAGDREGGRRTSLAGACRRHGAGCASHGDRDVWRARVVRRVVLEDVERSAVQDIHDCAGGRAAVGDRDVSAAGLVAGVASRDRVLHGSAASRRREAGDREGGRRRLGGAAPWAGRSCRWCSSR